MDEKKQETPVENDQGKRMKTVLFLLLCILGGAFIYFYAFDHWPAKGMVTIDIPKEASGREIGDRLEEKGVIRSSMIFRAMIIATGNQKALQSGHYRMHQGLTVKEAIEELKSGREDVETVTVPEGYTAARIAELLKKAGISGGEDFLAEASSYAPASYMYGPEPAEIKGEGFLFADTYEIPKAYTARQICDLMYKRTDEMLAADIRKQAEKKKLTIHELMTIASMVEREARFKEDQEKIASVILARLEKGMRLQIDATVQYALGRQKAELSLGDTKVDSPYNTYIRNGLPPGPIGSPGMDAIRAVLKAEPGEYLYYVAEKDGHHVFTKTYEEHEAEVSRIYGSDG